METKHFDLEIKSLGEAGEFTGYASTFNNRDEGGDIVLPGAFLKTLKKHGGKVPILADHNMRSQIGWGLEASEDDKGLKVKGMLDLNVQAAKEKYSLAKTAKDIGAKMGLSIGYATVKKEWQDDTRLLKELELYEYSFTAMPMNTRASVTSLKQLLSPSGEMITDVRTFEKVLCDVGFSNQKAKAIASFAFNLSGHCDGEEMEGQKGLLEAIERLTGKIKS